MRRAEVLVAAVLAVAASAPGRAAGLDAPAARARIEAQVQSDLPQLLALYKDLHAHPELGFQEVRTAARLAKEMRALGFEVTDQVGRTGLVALYRNGPGPTLLVRADMDGLPMEEATGLPYASRNRQIWQGKESFVAHSCGHDAHMAIWVGAAKALLASRADWSGTLMFVAQPSEEPVDGARAMVEGGLFRRFGTPDYGFALHVAPVEVGTVLYRAGTVTSNSDWVDIEFKGRGGHGSQPHTAIDPVLIASRFVVDVQSVISREKDPSAFGVVTIGAIQGGSAGNIIPENVQVRGTVRSYNAGVREGLLRGIERTAWASAQMAGAPDPVIRISPGAKAVVNDASLTARTAAIFRAAYGPAAQELPTPSAGSEDYSEFIAAGVPSLYFSIGALDPALVAAARNGGSPVPINHSPNFAPVPEPTIRTGVTAMTLAVLGVLGPR